MPDYGKVKCEFCEVKPATNHLRCFVGDLNEKMGRIYACSRCMYRLIDLQQGLQARGLVYYWLSGASYHERLGGGKGSFLTWSSPTLFKKVYPDRDSFDLRPADSAHCEASRFGCSLFLLCIQACGAFTENGLYEVVGTSTGSNFVKFWVKNDDGKIVELREHGSITYSDGENSYFRLSSGLPAESEEPQAGSSHPVENPAPDLAGKGLAASLGTFALGTKIPHYGECGYCVHRKWTGEYKPCTRCKFWTKNDMHEGYWEPQAGSSHAEPVQTPGHAARNDRSDGLKPGGFKAHRNYGDCSACSNEQRYCHLCKDCMHWEDGGGKDNWWPEKSTRDNHTCKTCKWSGQADCLAPCFDCLHIGAGHYDGWTKLSISDWFEEFDGTTAGERKNSMRGFLAIWATIFAVIAGVGGFGGLIIGFSPNPEKCIPHAVYFSYFVPSLVGTFLLGITGVWLGMKLWSLFTCHRFRVDGGLYVWRKYSGTKNGPFWLCDTTKRLDKDSIEAVQGRVNGITECKLPGTYSFSLRIAPAFRTQDVLYRVSERLAHGSSAEMPEPARHKRDFMIGECLILLVIIGVTIGASLLSNDINEEKARKYDQVVESLQEWGAMLDMRAAAEKEDLGGDLDRATLGGTELSEAEKEKIDRLNAMEGESKEERDF